MSETFVQPQPQRVTSPAPQTPAKKDANCCGDTNCGTCLKGGMPFKKEVLSFLTIILVGVSTLFFTLWVVELRGNGRMAQEKAPVVSDSSTAAAEVYVLPVPPESLETIQLPEPDTQGGMTVEAALNSRRSIRTFQSRSVTLADLSQLLWAGQGVTDDAGHRTAPSARGLYPHTLYVVVRDVADLEPGLYRYEPATHTLSSLGLSDVGDRLTAAGVQPNSQTAPAVIAVGTAVAKMQESFPETAQSVSDLEAGHIGQNIYLQAQSLALGTVVTAGFDTAAVGSSLGLDSNELVTYLIPFGYPEEVTNE